MSSEINSLKKFGGFRLDAERKVLWFENEPVNLPLKEIELLCVLAENGGGVVTKDELLNKVWADSFVEESNLSRHIYRLRKTFEEFGESAELIQTVPRRGYRFTGEINGNDSRELIIEKYSITQTLIEELENSAEPNVKVIRGEKSQISQNYLLLMMIGCLVILTTALGYYFFNQNKNTAAANNSIKSIAILPLKSLGNEENDKALGLGFADALITSLGKLDEVKVLSTNAVSNYVDKAQEPVAIGKKLNVDAIIDGTLQRANGKYRVTLRLIRANDGKQIWSDSFDKPESEIFQLQDLMAMQTSSALSVKLKTADNPNPLTENQDAYRLYLQGQYFFRRRETGKGGEFFKKAVEIDPKFAKAWAGLAAAYAMGDAMDEAETTVNKALELDPDLAEAHAVRGFIKMFLNWDWTEAEESLNRAVELDKNSVEAHHWRGVYLTIRGRFEEAKVELERALELDPRSANMISDLGQIYYFSGESEKAENLYLKANSIDGNINNKINKVRLIDLYEKQGEEKKSFEWQLSLYCNDGDEANKTKCRTEFNEIFVRDGTKGITLKHLNYYLKNLTDKQIPGDRIAASWHAIAIYRMRLGDKEKALESLNKTVETRSRFGIMSFIFPFLRVDPAFNGLHDDARFQEILRKMNLQN